ncbi:cell shape determination protein CcmA, partial [Thioclava marina]
AALSLAALLYVIFATGMGLVISSFISSQIAAIFATSLLTLLPAVQFSGLVDPVSSLEGLGAFIGNVYPASYFVTVSRGVFSKALGFDALGPDLLAMALSVPVIFGLGVALLKKQAR